MTTALLPLLLLLADLVRLAPDPGPQSGRTTFEFQTSHKADAIVGLEVLIDGTSAHYFSEPPFRTDIDLADFPEGELKVTVVLSLFSGKKSQIDFQLVNLKPTYEENVNLVRVPLLLEWSAEDRIAVPSLANFKLWEDGREMFPTLLLGEEQPIELVVLLDCSGSMQDRMGLLYRGMRMLLERLGTRDTVTLLGFGTQIFQLAERESDRDKILRALARVRPEGDTNLYGAVHAGLKILQRSHARRALVLFTDGRHELEAHLETRAKTLDDCLTLAASAGVPIYALGVGAALDREVLQQLADVSGGKALALHKTRSIELAFDDLGQKMSRQYLLCYPSPSRLWGDHQIRIEPHMLPRVVLRYPTRVIFQEPQGVTAP